MDIKYNSLKFDLNLYMMWLNYCFTYQIIVLFFHRYYALEVSYFKSSLDRKLLELLWNKYWVNTLSSSSLLTVSTVLSRDVTKFYLIYISCLTSETLSWKGYI